MGKRWSAPSVSAFHADPPPPRAGEAARSDGGGATALALLRPYAAVFAARFKLLLQYRAAALAGFATQCWWGVMRIMVFAAFFHGAAGAQPLSLRQTIAYVWLGQAFLTLLPWTVDPDTTRMVRSGDIVFERLRPLDPYAFWLARALARRVVQPLMRAAPMALTAGVLLPAVGLGAWGLQPPAGAPAALLFAIALVGAAALSGVISTLMDVAVAATLSDRGVGMVMTPLALVLSGNIVPLPLLPTALRAALFWQPFAGMTDIPFRIYFGELAGPAAVLGLVQQWTWIALLALAGRWLMGRTMTRLQVQGG